jgi:hypothetical protein
MRLRKFLLFGVLAAIVGLLLLDPPAKGPELVAASRDGTAPDAAKPASGARDALQLPDRRELARPRGELFGAPPPPPRAAAPEVSAPPVPTAPPMPYRFAGKVLKGGEEEVLLSKGDVVFPIKVGDLLDGMYKVESIGAERIELLYVPLGTKERIVVTSVLDVERAPPGVASAPAPRAAPAATGAALAAPAPLADGKPAQLRWEGPARVEAGASFNVALRVSTQEPLRAAPMQLRFEPGVLEPVHVRPGKFFGQGNFSYRVNPEGSIFVGATSPAAAPGADAELVVVTFKPIKRGATAELSMGALSLQGAAGRAIAHEQVTTFRAAIH